MTTLTALLAVLSVLALGLPGAGVPTARAATVSPSPTPSTPPAPAPVPVTPAFTGPVDVPPVYQGQALCDPAPKPGTLKLAALIRTTYPSYPTIGMERSCSAGGQSEHKDGRALDWMVSARLADQKAAADAFLGWLLAPDSAGVAAANARRLGIMYVGWNNLIWRGYGTTGWKELFDCRSNPDRAATTYDNYCHRNHVHISLSWDGAVGTTSFYDGSSMTAAACAAPTTSPTVPAAAAYRLIPVPATRVLSTTSGFGTATKCRAFGPGWSGQRRAVAVKITGRGGVPATGVGAVLLRVYPVSNTTSTVRVWTAGASAPTSAPAASVYAGRATTSTYVVPVASDGTVRISTVYGAAAVAADVLAWAPAATALAASTVGKGNITVQAPTRATTVLVPAGQTIVVPLGGRAGLPTAGMTGVQLHVTATGSASTARGSIRIGSVTADGGPLLPSGFTVPVSGLAPRSGATTVSTSDGRISVANLSAVPVSVALDVLGRYGAAADQSALRLVPRTPARLIDTTTALNVAGRLALDSTTAVTLPSTSVPVGTRGLVLQVQTFGRGASGGLTIAPTGAQATGRSIEVSRSLWTTELVMVPLGADLGLTLRTNGTGADVRAFVVGYLR